jgi:hypothetical protein
MNTTPFETTKLEFCWPFRTEFSLLFMGRIIERKQA